MYHFTSVELHFCFAGDPPTPFPNCYCVLPFNPVGHSDNLIIVTNKVLIEYSPFASKVIP